MPIPTIVKGKRVSRVSLSDCFAFQARIRGSKDPRLLRDRPTDGAAMAAKNYAVILGEGALRGVLGGGSCGSVFQTVLPYRQESGGLKTPGY